MKMPSECVVINEFLCDKFVISWVYANCEITYVLRYGMHWAVNYELCNHATVRPFMGDELMCEEFCDGFHCGDSKSLITLRHDKLKRFWKQLRFENNWLVVCIV